MSHRAKNRGNAAPPLSSGHRGVPAPDAGHSGLGLERIVFFSDAVFAIAITLLVLEIRLPPLPLDASDRDLLLALVGLIPRLAGFLVSFFLIGQTWVEHHKLWGCIGRHDTGLVWKNLFMLLFVAVVPFTTALFSEHHTSRVALVVYAAAFALMGLAKVALWRHARAHGLLYEDLDAGFVASLGARTWAGPLGALVVLGLASARVPFAWGGFMAIPILALLLHRSARP